MSVAIEMIQAAGVPIMNRLPYPQLVTYCDRIWHFGERHCTFSRQIACGFLTTVALWIGSGLYLSLSEETISRDIGAGSMIFLGIVAGACTASRFIRAQ